MMEEIIEELVVVISKEVKAFNQLLKTLREKQRAIVEGEIERLKKQVTAETRIVHETKTLEAQRIAQTRVLAEVLALDNMNPRLSEIIEKIEAKYAQRLTEQRSLLKSLMEKIRSINESNQFLLNYSLQFIESSLSLLLSGNDDMPVYQQDGTCQRDLRQAKILDQRI
ncbi:MAG: flagellar protein FlgN [bacterium]